MDRFSLTSALTIGAYCYVNHISFLRCMPIMTDHSDGVPAIRRGVFGLLPIPTDGSYLHPNFLRCYTKKNALSNNGSM